MAVGKQEPHPAALLLKRNSHKHTNLVTGISPLILVPNTFLCRDYTMPVIDNIEFSLVVVVVFVDGRGQVFVFKK